MGYPKQVYQKANEELARRRQAAADLTAARVLEIARVVPEAPRIMREMAETAMNVTRTVIANPQRAEELISQLRERNLALQEQRAQLLKSAGYPADYLAEQKACDTCGGSGYIGSDLCGCLCELLKKEAAAQLGAVSQAENCTFENFNLGMYPDKPDAKTGVSPRAQMAEVFAACKDYAQAFTPKSPSLLMIGHTGLGKTHLSLAIAQAATRMGYGVLYTPVQRLTDKLESTKFSYAAEAKEQYAQDMESVLTCDLLVLDDLGAEFITQFSSSVIYNIVNTRLVEGRPFIISTNLEPAELEAKYSQRMFSRLIGGCRAFKFAGRDIRFLKKMKT